MCKSYSELAKMKPENGDVFFVEEEDCWLSEPPNLLGNRIRLCLDILIWNFL